MWSIFVNQTVNSYDEVIYEPTGLGFAAMIGLCLLFLFAALAVGSRQIGSRNMTRQLVFSAMAIALASVASEIRLFKMPLGGSVTLCSMLFITLIGYWYGAPAGIMTGLAHGVIQLILNPQIYSLPQMLVDYPLAFAALGLSGFFRSRKHGLRIGYLVGVFGRFIFAFLSGWLFFAYYAPEGWNSAVYSAAYNAAYLGAEAAITAAILSLRPVAGAMDTVRKFAIGQK